MGFRSCAWCLLRLLRSLLWYWGLRGAVLSFGVEGSERSVLQGQGFGVEGLVLKVQGSELWLAAPGTEPALGHQVEGSCFTV